MVYLGNSNVGIGTAIGVVGIVGSAIGLTYLYKKKQQNTPPKKWRHVGEITELFCYPIKSCAPIRMDKVNCQQMGVFVDNLRDRVFMVTSLEGQFLTARTYPKLLQVQPKIDGDYMILSAPEMDNLKIHFPTLKQLDSISMPKITVWAQPVRAVNCGDEAARWFSQYLFGEPMGAWLVFYPDNKPMRDCVGRKPNAKRLTNYDAGCLHDVTSFSMINNGSISELNGRLDSPTTALQFRPNFVVTGPKPFEEDTWQWITIGNTIYKNVKEITRCVLVNIDPDTSKRNPKFDPIKTLQGYRQIVPNETPVMGIHLGIRQMGSVSIGDRVLVGCD